MLKKIIYSMLLLSLAACISNSKGPNIAETKSEKFVDKSNKVAAFRGAQGFGKYAIGGRGGDVYHVVNLNNHGVGSLRHAIKSASGPRTVVFNVSGNIVLTKKLVIDKSYITIAGQTAPGDGITLSGHALRIEADHVIIRFIRSRLGDVFEVESDAVSIASGSNIILDHVSASWSVDEVLSIQGDSADLITVQWSIVTESLNNSVHQKGTHGYGGIIGGLRQSYHHNLFANHFKRSPKVTWRRHTKVDYRNNVVYNWGKSSCYDGTSSHSNWVNNYYKAGPATPPKVRSLIFKIYNDPKAPDLDQYQTQFYIDGNVVETNRQVSNDNWRGGVQFKYGATEQTTRRLTPFDYPVISQTSAEQAYFDVLEFAGASIKRDDIDIRTLNSIKNNVVSYGKYGFIDSQNDVGGWPELESLPPPIDSDLDGMPDYWEQENGLDIDDSSDRNLDRNGDGYTELEGYLHSLVKDHYPESFAY